jgi:pimeloyl-ACP methyl ester carboxylesterase
VRTAAWYWIAPGWGFSSSVDYFREYKQLVADILFGVLDGLAIDRAYLIGGSIGNVWVLALAARYGVDGASRRRPSAVAGQSGPGRSRVGPLSLFTFGALGEARDGHAIGD